MIAMAKAAFNKKRILFTNKLDLNLRKKLVKCYIWSIGLCGAGTWDTSEKKIRNTRKVLNHGTLEDQSDDVCIFILMFRLY
jgi:hypothetical protein